MADFQDKTSTSLAPDYHVEREKCKDFLQNFVSDYGDGTLKYMIMLKEVSNRTRRVLEVDLSDVQEFKQDEAFVAAIMRNTVRYASLFCDAVDLLMPAPSAIFLGSEDVFDVLTRMRRDHMEDAAAAEGGEERVVTDAKNRMPAELTRRYELRFVASNKVAPPVALRDVKASHIGRYVTVKGMVTRVGDVRPQVQVATYTCDECGYEIYQMVKANSYMPLSQCVSALCRTNNRQGQLTAQTRGSKFIKFQDVKLQELAEHVPVGHIPRQMSVNLTGELTRQVGPGDIVEISGVFLPLPFTGFQAMRAGLTADTYLDAMHVVQTKKKYDQQDLSGEFADQVEDLKEDPGVYAKLARSIAPEIYGHEDVKKALLLLMVGAGSREISDGLKIRGDIHVCLMGDPGVAKSQLLKHIVGVAPRAVYTTGKGSSGVGLTASVTRDSLTGEMCLEGGALVLADNGICAIDEFDKMDEVDRTAIHEVMEQQTVSIAKAGITTTLNARTSVLAAANPQWGRYDLRRTPAENINLPFSLLSRFDLLWLILDTPNEELDQNLAQHVLHVHRHAAPPLKKENDVVEPKVLQAYIAAARRITPHLTPDLVEFLAQRYAEMRQQEKESAAPHSYTTARTLLSILRLSQALARLRFSTVVTQDEVNEALSLMQMSKISLDEKASGGKRGDRTGDKLSEIYELIRTRYLASGANYISVSDIRTACATKGLTENMLQQCLDEYEELNVWTVDEQGRIFFAG
eukprot:jgi/Mesvir1/27418/Mv07214-RA.1